MNILISYNWLKEYLDTRLSAQGLAKSLTLSGPEVVKIHNPHEGLEKVVVGEILEIKKHPEADKLYVSKVNIGKKVIQVIFGQVVKIEPGRRVPVAVAPTKLPSGLEVRIAKFRGLNSEGMLCLDRELGLGETDQQMRFFDKIVKPGTSIVKALDLKDAILEIEVTPNRPDCLSVLGIAREASATSGAKFLQRKLNKILKPRGKIQDQRKLTVEVKSTKYCSRYTSLVMDRVKIRPSPWWLKKRLILAGIRPINNVVDITNYVMLEIGQPMHAFDYHKLSNPSRRDLPNFSNKKIIVRLAKPGEKIVALDGKEYKLSCENLIIADGVCPIAIAGVMGAEGPQVNKMTTTIVLESANFDAILVRKTARSLNLLTDASSRFEKGLSPETTLLALKRAVELIQQEADGQVASPIIDRQTKKTKKAPIKLNIDSVERFLGVKISPEEIIHILVSLGFKVHKKKGWLSCQAPFWRESDITIPADLIEEIARIYGFHLLPQKLPEGEIPWPEKNWPIYWEDQAREVLRAAGMTEVLSYSFVSSSILKAINIDPEKCLRLLNPLNEDLEYMRLSLIPSVLEVVAQNQKIKKKFKIFELAKVYIKTTNSNLKKVEKSQKGLPEEKMKLCGAIVGLEKDLFLFYEAKGILEFLFKKMGLGSPEFKLLKAGSFLWKAQATASIETQGLALGKVGELRSQTLLKFSIKKKKVVLFNLDFDRLISFAATKKSYESLPRFPSIELDLAMVLPQEILWQEVKRAILDLREPFLVKIELFDIYQGEKIERGKKSLAFRLTYQAPDRTLKFDEAEVLQQRIINTLKEKLGAKLREV